MIKLRTAIQTKLETLHPRVYHEAAPDDVVYPYVVYAFTGINDSGEYTEQGYLDIDGWDLPVTGDTTELENLMTTVNAGLNKKILTTEGVRIVLYLDNRLSLVDDDANIKRRKYIYQVKIYKGA